ncbi:MAG: amidohydrolase, partial [Deltaproteobacteria bacterium]
LEAADYTFNYSAVWRERPIFQMKPSEYFRRQVYGCYFFEEFAPQKLIDEIGADRILFETDYPHPVCLYGNVREKIDAGLAGQTPEIRRKLLWENAAQLYKVPEPDRPVPIA